MIKYSLLNQGRKYICICIGNLYLTIRFISTRAKVVDVLFYSEKLVVCIHYKNFSPPHPPSQWLIVHMKKLCTPLHGCLQSVKPVIKMVGKYMFVILMDIRSKHILKPFFHCEKYVDHLKRFQENEKKSYNHFGFA